jgi:superfamily II DNA or RNA helicase
MISAQLDSTPWTLNVKPRKWQELAFQKWQQDMKGVISVVTGGGKTVFSFLCILEFRRRYPDKKIIIIVPTIMLLDQWYVSCLEDALIPRTEIACFSAEDKPKKWATINILVINTARRILKSLKNKNDYFLVVDECHRAGSPLNGTAIKGNYAATLGLSATPEREYDDGLTKYIVPYLGEIIYRYDYLQALEDKIIASFELQNVKVEMLPHEEKQYRAINKKLKHLLEENQETTEIKSKLKSLLIQRAKISSAALLRVPVSCKIAEANRKERVIIFHESIDAANKICEILNARKTTAVLYHSGIGAIIRRDNLRLYRKGVFNVLVTCKALDEGMNAPETSVAIIASSTASHRQRIQRLGRVLRPAKNKTRATIYTLYATAQERARLLKEYRELKESITIKWLKSMTA